MTTSWEDLSEPQKCSLAFMADTAGRGLFYMPSSIGARSATMALTRKGLAEPGPFARHEDTGHEGPSFSMTSLGARVAAQEPGHDRCHLPMPT